MHPNLFASMSSETHYPVSVHVYDLSSVQREWVDLKYVSEK